jgi:DNA-binding NtrC family response regulator
MSTKMSPPEGELQATVLIVDDDEAVRDSLSEYLMDKGWTVETAESADEALELVADGVGDIVVTDIRMPGMNGLTLLRTLREADPDIEVLITTGFSNESVVIEALKSGASDYFRKPLNGADVAKSLTRTRRMQSLKRENRRLKALLSHVATVSDRYRFVGTSDASRQLITRLERLAASPDTTVLLTGESGVGKEVAARMIHHLSRSADAPFVAVNCGGIAETLLESQLFGHERGAFTGADKRTPGIFEAAAGGTVLLDEISEMSMAAQSRFLRVLEDRRFTRVGGTREIKLGDTRIIAATNRDLKAMVDAGDFREDLYYRVMVAPIAILPLRERRDDILPLAYAFLEQFNKKMNRTLTLSPQAERALYEYDCPGNARDVRNLIERACIFTDSDVVQPVDLGLTESGDSTEIPLTPAAPTPDAGGTLSLRENEVALIRAAVERHPKNHSAAARKLGITPQALYRKIEKYGLG